MKSFLHPTTVGVLACLCLLAPWMQAAEPSVPLLKDGFNDWKPEAERLEMSRFTAEAAHRTGGTGLHVSDDSTEEGSSAASPRVTVKGGHSYRLTFQARVLSGGGLGVYMRFFDAAGKRLKDESSKGQDSASLGQPCDWRGCTLNAVAPATAATADIWVHSYAASKVTADFDEMNLVEYDANQPPWKGVYKIAPGDKARLTEADVPGPDGLVYPDWSSCGLPAPIPHMKTAVGPEFFAGLTEKNIEPRLTEALHHAARSGGGAVQLPPGVFYLDRPVFLRENGVVIRGAGRDKTRLIYRDHVPYGEIRLMNLAEGEQTLGPGGCVEFQANPKDLALLRIAENGNPYRETVMVQHAEGKARQPYQSYITAANWGNRYSIQLLGTKALHDLGAGAHTLEVTVEYLNGEHFSKSFMLNVTNQPQNASPPDEYGAIILVGAGQLDARDILLAEDGARGSRTLRLQPDHGLKAGDRVDLVAPASERWNLETSNQCPWGIYRANQYQIVAVDGDRITLNQPMRLAFPAADGTRLRRIGTVEGSGVESLTVEQQVFTPAPANPVMTATLWYPMEDLWTDGVVLSYAWGCWVRDVRVVNSGRDPLYATRSKFCEIRDCACDGAIFRGGGGTGYVGFQTAFDCLMENVTTHGMRHAPDLQWGASGNVVRNSSFHGSDGQWHAGWANENLFEGNRIELTDADLKAAGEAFSRSYGSGLFATGPSDPVHGPEGPRNVVYGNNISAPNGGLRMMGGNEGWIVEYNRFQSGTGYAIYGKEKSFDHVIRGNVFAFKNPEVPAVCFDSPDCTGIELTGNAFYGPVTAVAGFRNGSGSFASLKDNPVYPWNPDPPLPKPGVPSIYLWERHSAADGKTRPAKLAGTPTSP